MPKFFVKSSQVNENKVNIIGEDVNHIANVLRNQEGDMINICNIDISQNFLCQIKKINKNNIECDIIEQIKISSEPNTQITIFQGLPKAEKMELLIQKCTELGVKCFVPVQMERCVVKFDSKTENKKIERWQKIAETAAKQSGRNIIPKVENIINLKNILNLLEKYDIVLIAYEKEEECTLKSVLKTMPKKDNLKIGIIIGPEGGIKEQEVESLRNAKTKVITLGKRILRTETVGLMMTSIILYELEET